MILDQLKSRTAAAHTSLEGRLLLVQGSPSVTVYVSYLRAMYGFVAPLELAFRQLPRDFFDALELERRSKAHVILEDLETIGRRAGHAPTPPPWCDSLPEQGSTPQALGALYVLEGSTLGARWLLRHLAPLAIDDCSGYLRSYGEDLGPMWQRMRGALQSYSQLHPERDTDVVTAALATFERLDAWFVRTGAAEVSRAA